jgi:histidyl-tRNA synthetase
VVLIASEEAASGKAVVKSMQTGAQAAHLSADLVDAVKAILNADAATASVNTNASE